MKKLKDSLLTTLIGLLVGYAGICIYFYSAQDSILFKPRTLAEGHAYNYDFEFEERWFAGTDDNRIHAIHAKAPDSSRGLVIFFHGNAGNNDTSPKKFTLFLDEGYDVLYPDYRSYGKSTGELQDEEDLVGDMKKVYEAMMEEYDESNIVLVGYSLGSGIAALVAAGNDPRALMLWTPYYSMLDMKEGSYPFLPDFLVKYPLRTDLALSEIEEPVILFFAEDDEILPVSRSIHLTDLLKETDEYIILEDQRHGWVFNNPALSNEIPRILDKR